MLSVIIFFNLYIDALSTDKNLSLVVILEGLDVFWSISLSHGSIAIFQDFFFFFKVK